MATPTLALIPGHLCDARLYAPQRALLEAFGPVRVAETGRDADLGAMAERMLAEIPGPLALVGLSMGGMVAMEALARAPERIAGATLLDTDPTPARPKERAWRADWVRRVAEEGLEPFAEAFAGSFFGHAPERAERLGPAVRAMMTATPVAVFEAQGAALDARRDLRAAVEGFAGPLLVAWGARDRVCPPVVHREIAAAGSARAVEIPDCGHLATLEAPDAVNAALAGWLARLG